MANPVLYCRDVNATGHLSLPKANATTDGYLSAGDWLAFSIGGPGGVPATRLINTTSPLLGGGNLSVDRTLSIQQATGLQDGYLSSVDWNTFNGKQNALAFPLAINLGGTNNAVAYTVGSVIFSNGVKLTENNPLFFWDDTAKAFCVGTNAQSGAITGLSAAGVGVGVAGQRMLSLTAGNGAANTTGGQGGGYLLVSGDGGVGSAANSGAGGDFQFTTGAGGLRAGAGNSGRGGNVVWTLGNGGLHSTNNVVAANGGGFSVTGGTGGENQLNRNGGVGGSFTLNGGTGGNNTNAAGGAGLALGGAGGGFLLQGGNGGTTIAAGNGGGGGGLTILGGTGGATSGAGNGGAGGDLTIRAGTGGGATGAGAGGAGGTVRMSGGFGGAPNGNGSNFLIDGGTKAGAGTDGNILLGTAAGLIGIKITPPTAYLHLAAGAAAASSSPLKFTSGVLLAAVEAGAVEFVTDDWYGTITTGPARKGFILNDGTNLTSGRIPFATTNGRLTDSASMTWDGTFGIKVKMIYGAMGGDDVAITVANSGVAIGVEVAVGAGLSSGSLNGFTFANSTLTAQVAGKYLANWSMTMTVTNNNEVLAGGVMINATAQPQTEGSAEAINGSKPVCVAGNGVITLAVADVVKLYTENDTAAHDITVTHGNLTLTRVDN